MRQSAFPASATTHFLSEDCTNISVSLYSLTFQAIESLLVCIFRLLVLRFRSVYSWALSLSLYPLCHSDPTQETQWDPSVSVWVSPRVEKSPLLPVLFIYIAISTLCPSSFCSPPTRTGTVRFACGAIRRPFDGHSVSPKSFLINSKANVELVHSFSKLLLEVCTCTPIKTVR